MNLSVIVPVLNEEAGVRATLDRLHAGLGPGDEVIVVDGGSRDRTVAIAASCGSRVLAGTKGRGLQMNLGASAAGGDVFLFLHADTNLPEGFRDDLEDLLADAGIRWGRYDLAFDRGGRLLHLIAVLISLRSRIWNSATGDQAIFVRREDFEALGGYREPELFEDVEFVRRVRARGAMGIPRGRAVTSSRRWRNRGVWRTTLRMWSLKSLYLLGVPSAKLSGLYRDER